MLNRYGEHYKALVTGAGAAPIAAFGCSVAVWDASPTHALALRVAASALPQAEQEEIYHASSRTWLTCRLRPFAKNYKCLASSCGG
jgi:hypothetical protein